MSDNEDGNTETVNRPARRKLLRKRPNRDDIFSYHGQIPLSFRAKQVKVDTDSSESEDNDEAFQRVQAEQYELKESPKTRESDSDGEEDIWITEDKSLEEIDSSTADIREVSFNTSPSPPPCPDLSAATRLRIHERQARDPRLRELDNVLENLKKSTNSNMSSPNYHRPPSVISLDDSFGLPSPSERNVVVKVRTRTGIQRFTMKACEPFGKIILQLAEQEGVTEDKIMLTLKEINILGYDTPISVHLNVADIIECVVMNTPVMTEKLDEEEANEIEIKVQGNDADSKKTFKISKTDPLENLMVAYCAFRKLPRSKIKFLFDGELLKGSETPVDLDMEEEDVIDVRVN